MARTTTFRVGDWLTDEPEALASWLNDLSQEVAEKKVPHQQNPVGGLQIENYDQMLLLLNAVLTRAPEFSESELVILPITAILDWSMGTPAGFAALNSKVNAMFEQVLDVWCEFLNSEASLYVLNDRHLSLSLVPQSCLIDMSIGTAPTVTGKDESV